MWDRFPVFGFRGPWFLGLEFASRFSDSWVPELASRFSGSWVPGLASRHDFLLNGTLGSGYTEKFCGRSRIKRVFCEYVEISRGGSASILPCTGLLSIIIQKVTSILPLSARFRLLTDLDQRFFRQFSVFASKNLDFRALAKIPCFAAVPRAANERVHCRRARTLHRRPPQPGAIHGKVRVPEDPPSGGSSRHEKTATSHCKATVFSLLKQGDAHASPHLLFYSHFASSLSHCLSTYSCASSIIQSLPFLNMWAKRPCFFRNSSTGSFFFGS